MADIVLTRREYGLDIPVRYVDIAGVYAQKVVVVNPDGTNVGGGGGGGGLTDAQLRASRVPVIDSSLTDGSARVGGTVAVSVAATLTVAGAGVAGTPSGGVLTVQGAATGTPLPVDVSDKAARLVGIVYGSRGQLVQTLTNLNLQAELAVGGTLIDPRSIRALTSADQVTVANATLAVTESGTWTVQPGNTANTTPWLASIHDGTNKAAVKAGVIAVAADNPLVVTIHPSSAPTAAQPVTIAAAVDVSDRAGRLVGVVYGSQAQQLKQTATNFNAQVEIAVGATLVDPRSIRALTSADIVTAAQGAANATPWNENLAQVGGSAIAIKALPTGGSGQAALPVYTNAIQLLTYTYSFRVTATGALTANTAKAILSFDHAASATKTVRIRRILVAGRQTTLLAGALDFQITAGTAQASAGTIITPGKRNLADANAELVCRSLPTITAATVQDNIPFAVTTAAAANSQGLTVIYDWQEAGESKPWTLRAGVLESFVINAISDAAQNWTLTIHVTVTEE